jgi:DNA-binding CsgD family transcriptional regulator
MECSYDSVVALLYESTLEPETFPAALDSIAQFVGASAAAYWRTNNRTRQLEFMVAQGHDASTQEAYGSYFHAREPNLAFMRDYRPGRWMANEEVFDVRNPAHHEYIYDFAFRHNMGWAAGVKVLESESSVTMLTLQRPVGAERFARGTTGDIARLFPHIQLAARISGRVLELAQGQRIATAVLETLAVGVCVLRADASIVFSNNGSRAFFGRNQPFIVSVDKLSARDLDVSGRLKSALTNACSPRPCGAAFTVPRDATGVLQVQISPISPKNELSSLSCEPLALLIASDSQASTPDPAILSALFALTRAEAILLASLAAGETINSIRERTGVALPTLRTQLSSIYAKTGSSNQAQAVAAAKTLPSSERRLV